RRLDFGDGRRHALANAGAGAGGRGGDGPRGAGADLGDAPGRLGDRAGGSGLGPDARARVLAELGAAFLLDRPHLGRGDLLHGLAGGRGLRRPLRRMEDGFLLFRGKVGDQLVDAVGTADLVSDAVGELLVEVLAPQPR